MFTGLALRGYLINLLYEVGASIGPSQRVNGQEVVGSVFRDGPLQDVNGQHVVRPAFLSRRRRSVFMKFL